MLLLQVIPRVRLHAVMISRDRNELLRGFGIGGVSGVLRLSWLLIDICTLPTSLESYLLLIQVRVGSSPLSIGLRVGISPG